MEKNNCNNASKITNKILFSDKLRPVKIIGEELEDNQFKQNLMGEGWNINPSKNDGYPYIEGLYW